MVNTVVARIVTATALAGWAAWAPGATAGVTGICDFTFQVDARQLSVERLAHEIHGIVYTECEIYDDGSSDEQSEYLCTSKIVPYLSPFAISLNAGAHQDGDANPCRAVATTYGYCEDGMWTRGVVLGSTTGAGFYPGRPEAIADRDASGILAICGSPI